MIEISLRALWAAARQRISACGAWLVRRQYHPERHYMRGERRPSDHVSA